MTLVLVVLGGTVGAALRGAIGHGMREWLPTGTLLVNLVASFGLGLASNLEGATGTAIHVGLLGALSTWSSLAYEIASMVRRGDRDLAALTLGISVLGGVALAWLGLRLAP